MKRKTTLTRLERSKLAREAGNEKGGKLEADDEQGPDLTAPEPTRPQRRRQSGGSQAAAAAAVENDSAAAAVGTGERRNLRSRGKAAEKEEEEVEAADEETADEEAEEEEEEEGSSDGEEEAAAATAAGRKLRSKGAVRQGVERYRRALEPLVQDWKEVPARDSPVEAGDLFSLELGGYPPAADPASINRQALTAQGMLAPAGGTSAGGRSSDPLLIEYCFSLGGANGVAGGGGGGGKRGRKGAAGHGALRLLDAAPLCRALGLPPPEKWGQQAGGGSRSKDEEGSEGEEETETEGESGEEAQEGDEEAQVLDEDSAEITAAVRGPGSGTAHHRRRLTTWQGLHRQLEGATVGQLAKQHHSRGLVSAAMWQRRAALLHEALTLCMERVAG